MRKKIKHLSRFFSRHFEWLTLTAGLLALALMNPYLEKGPSWCLFELINVPYCPGEGLGHSIAYIFRGDIYNALEANMLGPFTVIILLSRIICLINERIVNFQYKK